METIVLVHGAWMDKSSWDKVIPFLQRSGSEIITLDLPGHGKDNTPPEKLSIRTYAEAVKNAIGYRTDVVLTGHSMAGMVISQTAELIPDKLKKLIYIGAMLPASGDSLLSLAAQDSLSQLSPAIIPTEDNLRLDVKKEKIISIFCEDASEDIKADVLKNFRTEPARPYGDTVTLTPDNFGRIEKTFLYTVNDRAITFDLQKKMVKKNGLSKTYELDSSHTPFYSMPEKVSEIILNESK